MRYASKTNIKITAHGMQRMKERTSMTVKNDILNLVSKARSYGIYIDQLDRYNYKDFNLSWDLYKFVKGNVYAHRSDRLLLYRDHIYCFTGNKDRTLKTVFCIPEHLKGWWKDA